ncbi:hypothetical protein EHW61_16990, partial [Salinivibrio sp. VYel6]|uniref:phage nozzle protein n=1 Tax=Salinivibrio sp. VYel6 TaxID=2490493 RepID=UPI001C129E61
MLINNEIPDLIGGVSQQAPLLRFPNQADEQINCSNSPIAGMSKRPNSHLVTTLKTKGAGMMDMKTHFMLRDSTEQYVYGVSDGRLHVYDLKTGFEYPVKNIPSYYLDSGLAPEREAFKFLSLGDDTYILNTTVPVQMDYTKIGDDKAQVKT